MRLQGFDLAHEKRNVELLQLLRADPRMTVSALARRIGMSAPAVRERLEEAGIIRGYRLEIDPAAFGYPIPIVIRVRPMPGKVSQVAQLAESTSRRWIGSARCFTASARTGRRTGR